jgi:hypothetical protein
MKNPGTAHQASELPRFERDLFEGQESFTCIGGGAIGGKAAGLAFADDVLRRHLPDSRFGNITVNIPRLTVLAAGVFDAFLNINHLHEIAYSEEPDHIIALAFQKGDLPADIIGDLRALINKVTQPLAIRSSSLLEDAIYEPFAGVYATKMIPNNQPDADTRFRKLIEAIKLVYASTFFAEARGYRRATGKESKDEKMSVIIQEVVGRRHEDRFYPDVAGVIRSYNFYPIGDARPEDGLVELAIGLGKTIVDGGMSWAYSPSFPKVSPPFTTAELLRQTQTEFWSVKMGRPPAFDPVRETEYMKTEPIGIAEEDGILASLVSTYDRANDRVVMGMAVAGPRIVNFAPLIRLDDYPLNELLITLERIFKEEVDADVEMEFALTFEGGEHVRFGFLQVRPMVVSQELVEVSDEEFAAVGVIVSSDRVMGNGQNDTITDIVFVKPDVFDAKETRQIVSEIDAVNRNLLSDNRPYLLIGFGRWGSSDPWLGIPVNWSNIAGARVLVEATSPNMNVELSQGSHFFHNISSFGVFHFSVRHDSDHRIDWEWLKRQEVIGESGHLCHVRVDMPIKVKVDGRSGRGVIRS